MATTAIETLDLSLKTLESGCGLAAEGHGLSLSMTLYAEVFSLFFAVRDVGKIITQSMPPMEIDPEDELDGRLCAIQARIREVYGKSPVRFWLVRWMLKTTYQDIGKTRTRIKEHDADFSPVSGSFDNIDDLFAHLDKL